MFPCGVIFNFYTDLYYVHIISIYFWAFLQNIVSLPMDLYAREILLQRKFLILPPRRDIPPSIPSKKRGVESRRSKHPFEPDLKKVLDLVGNLLPIFDSYKIGWIPTDSGRIYFSWHLRYRFSFHVFGVLDWSRFFAHLSSGVCWRRISEVVDKVCVRVRDRMSLIPLSLARRVAMACTGGVAEGSGPQRGEW